MTIEEARRFVDEAERLPVDEVDVRRLVEAHQTIMLPFPQDAQLAARVSDLVTKVVDRRGQAEVARLVGSTPVDVPEPDREAAEQAAAMTGDLTPGVLPTPSAGSAVPRADESQMLIPSSLKQRLREAAAGAGIPDVEVDALISQTEAVLAQALSQGQGDMVTPEMLLGDTLAEWEAQAAANTPSPIGVPPGFAAQVTERPEALPGMQGRFGQPGPPRIREQEPRYFQGDQLAPASMPPEQIIQIQRQLEDAGLIEAGQYWEGFWDDATAAAYEQVLGYSNQRGTEWQATLQDLIDNVPEGLAEQRAAAAAADVFVEPAYIKPDYATLAQDVKGMFRSRLGRDPSEAELREMAGALSGSWKAAHDAAVAAARAEFQTGQSLEEQALEGDMLPSSTSPGTFTSVDPAARFAELFEQRYRPELSRLDALGAVRQNSENVFASVRTLDSLIGGGS